MNSSTFHHGNDRAEKCHDANQPNHFRAKEHRMEARVTRRVGLEFSGPDEPLIYETTFTENVSRHEARVVTKRRWSPHDKVLVKLPEECLFSRARITYCQPSKGDAFAMGLQFSLVVTMG